MAIILVFELPAFQQEIRQALIEAAGFTDSLAGFHPVTSNRKETDFPSNVLFHATYDMGAGMIAIRDQTKEFGVNINACKVVVFKIKEGQIVGWRGVES